MFPWYRNQSKDLNYRSTDWYLCDRNIDLKWINKSFFHSARILTLVFVVFRRNIQDITPTMPGVHK